MSPSKHQTSAPVDRSAGAVGDDVLSDVLRAVRLRGAVFFDVEAASPWVAEAPEARIVAPAAMPGADRVIEYHVVTSGACWAATVGTDDKPVRLAAGDVVAFPQGDAHVLSSAPGMRGQVDMGMFQAPAASGLPLILDINGGGAERAHVVCGFLACDSRPFNPLIDALPRVLHVPAAANANGNWLGEFTRFAMLEANAKRAGAGGILSKLGELMFAELVRHYLEGLPSASRGWLAGLRDAQVGRALNLLHAQPARDWSLIELAKQVGMSRTSLVDRFAEFVGVPPMQYLKRWRLQIAAARLHEGNAGVAAIAADIGYESEAAFSRAFKKSVGVSPAEWRGRKGSTAR